MKCKFILIFALLLGIITACEKEVISEIESEMILVEGGTFMMGCTGEQGSDCRSNEYPAHEVTLNSFNIAKYKVTQKQWEKIMKTTVEEQRNLDHPYWYLGGVGDDYPMYYVSWDDVQEFIKKLNKQTGKNYRLPTEAEWEYAAHGGNRSLGYKYSGSNKVDDVAWYNGNAGGNSHPVGTRLPNELGIYDMSGNIAEWCNDWYGEYQDSPQHNPQGQIIGNKRVVRGNSWYWDADRSRICSRGESEGDGVLQNARYNGIGFRLVCD